MAILPDRRPPRGIWYYPRILRKRYYRTQIQELAKLAGVERFDLIWSFDASRYLDLDTANVPSIFYLADFNARMPWRKLAKSATLCLSCSWAIVEKLKKLNRNSFFLQHGHGTGEPLDFSFPQATPNVTYSGNLAHMAIDEVRILRLVDHYPKVHFHFFGDDGRGYSGKAPLAPLALELRNRPNCSLHGIVPASQLGSIYRRSDALLVAHKPGFDQLGNPHKMMEYLASGRPILSTRLREYDSLQDDVLFVDDLEAYVLGLETILNGAYQDGQKRQLYAEEHSYQKQVQRVEGMLRASLGAASTV